jgi:glyoxylase-like metal-dependent hydrolase (beta-lactamase superfamily II)
MTADGAIVAVATPGHTGDHLSVVVEDQDTAIFIAGDASYNEEAMVNGAIDCVSDNDGQAAATLAAIRAFVRVQPTVYLPAHDPQACRRLAERRPTGSRQSITAWAAASSRETGAADFVERISASSGKAQSATKVMNRKLLE